MLDSIQAVSMNRLIDANYNQEVQHNQETLHTQDARLTLGTPVDQTTKSLKTGEDSVSISFNLYGDLNKLKDSINVVNQQVKTQLEKYYGIVKDPTATQTELTPKEDASAQDLLEFYNPANTASRIVDFTTGYLSQYQQNHTDKTNSENIDGFITMLKGAVGKGFDEAEKILGSYDKLGDIGANIKETYKRVVKGLEEYQQKYLAKNNSEQPASLATEPVASEPVIPKEVRTVIPLV